MKKVKVVAKASISASYALNNFSSSLSCNNGICTFEKPFNSKIEAKNFLNKKLNEFAIKNNISSNDLKEKQYQIMEFNELTLNGITARIIFY